MTEEELLERLAGAMGYRPGSEIGLDHARRTLRGLQARGLNVYKRKVFRQHRRPTSSAPMTPELRAAIFEDYHNNPHLTQHQIAVRHNVNSGRVNEIINGSD